MMEASQGWLRGEIQQESHSQHSPGGTVDLDTTTQLHLSRNSLVTTAIFIKVLRLFFQIKDDQFVKTKMIDRTLPVCESTYR